MVRTRIIGSETCARRHFVERLQQRGLPERGKKMDVLSRLRTWGQEKIFFFFVKTEKNTLDILCKSDSVITLIRVSRSGGRVRKVVCIDWVGSFERVGHKAVRRTQGVPLKRENVLPRTV